MLRRAQCFCYGRPTIPLPVIAPVGAAAQRGGRNAVAAKWLGPAVASYLALTHGVPMTLGASKGAAQTDALKEAFNRLDLNKDGYISPAELRGVMMSLGLRLQREAGWTPAAVQSFILGACGTINVHSRKGLSFKQFKKVFTDNEA